MAIDVCRKTWRDQRRGIVGWGTGIVALVAVEAALWPSLRDMPGIDEMLEKYPAGLKELFDIDSMTTGTGFLNAELFSIMLPAMFLVFAISRGGRLVAGEEQDGLLATVLTTPLSRSRVLLEKAAALVAAVAALAAVLFVAVVAASAATSMGVAVVDAATAAVAIFLFGVEFGLLTLAIGAATGRRAVAVSVAALVAGASYVLYVASSLVDAVRPWRVLSPFQHALHDGPIGAGLSPTYLLMVLVAAIALAVAVPAFERRDLVT